jgi:dCMP deaminase
MDHDRLTRDALFMRMAMLMAERATCTRKRVGAVIVKDRRAVSMGYVGSPAGQPHCIEVGCDIGPDGGCIRTVHAEANAIAFAAKVGISTEGATLYTSLSPCLTCAKLMINAGIARVVYHEIYRDGSGLTLLHVSGITTDRLTDDDRVVGDE